MNKKKQRVHSAFIRVNPKNLAQDTNKKKEKLIKMKLLKMAQLNLVK